MKTHPLAIFLSRVAVALHRLDRRWADSQLSRFWRWWLAQLVQLLPVRLRALLCREAGRALYRWREGDFQQRLDVPGVEPMSWRSWRPAETAATRPDPPGIGSHWLLVPAAQVLSRRLNLPLAAAPRLREVLAFEIDRQTPFRPGDVVFDHRLLSRDQASGKLIVELVVLPVSMLETAIAALPGLSLDGVDVAGDDGSPWGLNLLPPERRRRSPDPARRANLILTMACVLLAGASLLTVRENRRQALEGLGRRVDSVREEAAQVAALREQLALAIDGAGFLEGAQAGQPARIEVLADITRRVPDGTWLERLSISDGRLSLVALGEDAAGLVGALQDSPWLRQVALGGTVQADRRAGRDRFTISALLVASSTHPPAPQQLQRAYGDAVR